MHRLMFMLYFQEDRFWNSLTPPKFDSEHEGAQPSPPPLPALLNAMYLIGCYLSEDRPLQCLEDHYLARTRRLLSESLGGDGGHAIQWLQAACLLAHYLWKRCRFLEARQEVRQRFLIVHFAVLALTFVLFSVFEASGCRDTGNIVWAS